MRRKVTKHGNESFSVVLPKPWVKKNGIKPREEIEIIELENKLIISPELNYKESDQEVLTVNSDCEDFLISKLVNIYRRGYNKIKIIHINDNKELIAKLALFASKMHGVVIEQQDNSIIMTATEGSLKKSEILNKSYLNLVWLSELITEENQGAAGWQKQVFEVYERIYFLCEYMFRIITIEGGTDFRHAINQHTTTATIQTLAEVLKNVGETESEQGIICAFGSASSDLKNIIKAMHEVCMLNRQTDDFYKNRSIILSKISERKYNISCIGYAHMCEYFCTKLIRQEIEEEPTPKF